MRNRSTPEQLEGACIFDSGKIYPSQWSWLTILLFIALGPLTGIAQEKRVDLSKGHISSTGFWLPESVEEWKDATMGPFIKLKNNDLLTVDAFTCRISTDRGTSWTSYPIFTDTSRHSVASPVLLESSKGTVILAFINLKEKANWNWRRDLLDSPGAIVPTYAVRSTDGGKTWTGLTKLHNDWTGMIRDMIETKDGTIVFTSMMMRHNPGRHTVLTYASKDDGKSWLQSNIIDLGGVGHHGGVMESTLIELKDGRLWMLLRTNWGYFWETFSEDRGLTWKNIGVTSIAASSSPGLLRRLKSGRIVLFYNRPYLQGENDYPTRGGDGFYSEVPISWQREELCISFSEDEGKTWSPPTVIAKAHADKKAWLSYPHILEESPGELWITTLQSPLRLKLKEKDFVR